MRNFRIRFVIILAIFPFYVFGQSADRIRIQSALDSLSIPLNRPKSPSGFVMTYGCDSIPFFKKVTGDTILFLTPGSMTPMSYESPYSFNSFSNWLKTKKVYPPTFPTRFASDDRIEIVNYSETTFLVQNDSLFEIELDRSDFLKELFKQLDKYTKGKIDSITMEERIEKADKKDKGIILKKLFFSMNMFSTQDTVKIPLKLNPNNATVILIKKWQINNVNAFTVFVNEKKKDYETEVMYSFDENFKFLKWEDCEE